MVKKNFCCLLLGIPVILTAQTLTWSPGGESGGDGVWDAGSPVWWDGTSLVSFAPDSPLVFPEPGGSVDLAGDFRAGPVAFTGSGYSLQLDNAGGSRLVVEDMLGSPFIGFAGHIGAGADDYPDGSVLDATGLEFRPAGTVRLEGDLASILGGSPVIGVRGADGTVEFAGKWYSNRGSIYSWLNLNEGGHFVLTGGADMRFIKEEGFYTLQLWVTGDGSGTLELAGDFVAERTEQGTVELGIGSMRIGAGTFITHNTANLPLGYRPRGDGTAQTNGHLVFENRDGSRWIVRGEDQVYPGAVWIHRDLEVIAESNLMHLGVTEFSSDYTAWNGWSVLRPVTIIKSGPGALTLAGEQSYASGASMKVREGILRMLSDPASGSSLGGGLTGAQLDLQVEEGGRLEWSTSGTLKALSASGSLLLDGSLEVGTDLQLGPGSRTEICLNEDSPQTFLSVSGTAALEGTLVISRAPGYRPPNRTSWRICEAGVLQNGFEVEDRTGLGLRIFQSGEALVVLVTRPAPDLPGEIWLEDTFEAPDAQWQDLSTVPRWGLPLANGTAFEWTDGVVRLIRSGERDTTSYTAYNTSNGLKTFTALDHLFPRPINHAGSEVTLDFRLRWPVTTTGSGEGGRVIFAFNHAYPPGGLDLTPEGSPGSRYNDFSDTWWGRPAYHVRLRNGTTRAGSTFLQYGGGADYEGEYEATASWWLPGFISGAGQVAPGAGDDFPENSWVRTREGMAVDSFTSFRYRILPDRQELWRDDNDDGILSDEELKAVMPLPETSEAPYYFYFPEFEGLRVFWNGRDENGADSGQMELDWLRLTVQENVSPVAEAGPDLFSSVLVEGMAPVRLDATGTVDPEGDPLLYAWRLDGEWLLVTKSPVAHARIAEGNYNIELVAIDPHGNYSVDTTRLSVAVGRSKPVVKAGPDQSIDAANQWFGIVQLSGANSFSPDKTLVRYQWSTGNPAKVLYDGPEASMAMALPLGTHNLTLTVWDSEGEFSSDALRVTVLPIASTEPAVVAYRENFSRPDGSFGEMGPWEVGWNLMRYDGEPVPSIKYDGNAHRSLSWDQYGNAPYFEKVAANPSGLEFDEPNAGGHMWMNQMPALNVTPGEWMLWTDEFTIDRTSWELARISFYGKDSSPENVKVSPAVRINGQWYIGWDLRLVSWRTSYWKYYEIPLSRTGWYLFEPSLFFTIKDATSVDRLPEGDADAFGFYFFKEYAWYVNEVDNFTLWLRPRQADNPYGPWLVDAVDPSLLADPANLALWEPDQDPDGDGWANIWEFACGWDPIKPDSGSNGSPVGYENGHLILDLPANPVADNLLFSAYSSADLLNWVPYATTRELYTDPSDGQLRQRYKVLLLLQNLDKRFFTWVPEFE